MPESSVGVHFERFWPGFSAEVFFLPLITAALGRRTRLERNRNRSSIIVSSVFQRDKWHLPRQSRRQTNSPQMRIWFTGENIRPPFEGHDLFLSFDLDPMGGKNVYFPLAFMSVLWPWQNDLGSAAESLEARRLGLVPTVSEISKRRGLSLYRERFACFFVSNMTADRLRLIEGLSRLGEVDVYGRAGKLGPVTDKVSVASKYRFMICPENDLFPGYVTEKVVDAWASGCVPIWWGIDQAGILNPRALVNLAASENLEDLVEQVNHVNTNEDEWHRITQTPLSQDLWSVDSAKAAIRACFESVCQ